MNVAGLVDEFLAEQPDWAGVGVDPMSYGHGLCEDASIDLLLFLRKRGVIEARTVWMTLEDKEKYGWPLELVPHDAYPRLPIGDTAAYHCVVLVEGVVVDLTPRQYDENLPFPFIWEVGRDQSR
jgi:hypothetical protein